MVKFIGAIKYYQQGYLLNHVFMTVVKEKVHTLERINIGPQCVLLT